MPGSWIAVDLDGTLAEYDGFKGPTVIGAPIPAMLERVQRWHQEGRTVLIFSSRVSHPDDGEQCREAIERWCAEHLGWTPAVTATKDYRIGEFWDDRAVLVEANTGRVLAAAPTASVARLA